MRVSILLQLTVLLGSGLKGTYGVPAPWGGWDGGKKMTAGVSDPTGVTLTDVVPTTSTQPEVTASQPEVITSDTPAPEVSSLGTTGGPTGGKGGGESHSVNLVNNCGSGKAVFIYRDQSSPQGSTTVNGPVYGGLAYVQGFSGADCQANGVNCGMVEFTLLNPNTDSSNTQNSINYSLQSQGNHQFTYKMDFSYTGSCSTGAPGPCTGDSAQACPGGFLGTVTSSGTPVQCVGSNTGITITFC